MFTKKLSLFNAVGEDLQKQGYSVQPNAINPHMAIALRDEISSKSTGLLKQAGVGRNAKHTVNAKVRSDRIEWIDTSTEPGRRWLAGVEELRAHINRQLFLGLDLFESHYAYYQKGAFYQRHKDAFTGESNRVLSLVAYLNPDWHPQDGGELKLYQDEHDHSGIEIQPMLGTLVLFLSEEFPHEVLPATRSRYSIAGWFRQKSTL